MVDCGSYRVKDSLGVSRLGDAVLGLVVMCFGLIENAVSAQAVIV